MVKYCWIIFLIFYINLKTNAQFLNDSNLPILSIKTKATIVDEPKIDGVLEVRSGSNALNFLTDKPSSTYSIGVELRGSSSQSFPKKSYGFETRLANGDNNNVSLLGFPADNDWILNGDYSDKTLIRNHLTYYLANKMGRYASRTKMVELQLNDQYLGLYLFGEKIKQGTNRVNISKLKPTDIAGDDLTGGYIIKIDKTTGNKGYEWTSNNNPSGQSQLYILEYPKVEDLQSAQRQYFRNLITTFENRVYATDYITAANNYKAMIDLNTFVDFFLINEAVKNVDGYRISTYMYKEKDSKGGKLSMGPVWDFNFAVGNADYCEGNTTTGWMVNFNQVCPQDFFKIPGYWARIIKDPEFDKLAKARWKDLRATSFSTANINKFIDSTAAVISSAQRRNFLRWPILGTYVWPNPFVGQTYDQEINYMKDWLQKRMIWMDNSALLNSNVLASETVVYRNLKAFPNPVKSTFSLQAKLVSNKSQFNLKSISGKLIQTLVPVFTNNNLVFTLPNIPTGVYFLEIVLNKNNTQYTKIYVE